MNLFLLSCVTLMLTAASGHEIRRLLADVDVRVAVDKLRGDDDVEPPPASFRDVAIDVDDERFLQITRLRISGTRLEGNFQLVSNSLAQDFRGGGKFSAPEDVVSLSRNLGPALVCAVRFFSDVKLAPGARNLLDEYLRRNDVNPDEVVSKVGGISAHPGNHSDSELVASEMYERLMSQDLDEIADFMLSVVRRKIKDSGKDEMEIPDQDCLRKRRHHKTKKVFYAAGGSMKGISRLSRAVPTKVRREGSVITVDCLLRLDRLDLRYEAYGLQLSRLKVSSGAVKGNVRASPVEVSVDVGVADDGCCNVSVRRLRVSPGDVRIRLDGLSPNHPMVARVGSCFADLFRDSVVPHLERVLKNFVTRTLNEFRCPR